MLTYDPTKATLVDFSSSSDVVNEMMAVNDKTPGVLRVAIASASPLTQEEVLLTLRFRLTDPSETTLIQPGQASLNEGQVQVQLVPGCLGGMNKVYLPLTVNK